MFRTVAGVYAAVGVSNGAVTIVCNAWNGVRFFQSCWRSEETGFVRFATDGPSLIGCTLAKTALATLAWPVHLHAVCHDQTRLGRGAAHYCPSWSIYDYVRDRSGETQYRQLRGLIFPPGVTLSSNSD